MTAAVDPIFSLELVLGEVIDAHSSPPVRPARSGEEAWGPGPAREAIPAAVDRAREALAEAVDAPTWAMSGAALGAAIVELEQLTSQAAALQTRLLAQASRGAGGWEDGSDDPAWGSAAEIRSWLAESLPVTRSEAARRIALAHALHSGREVVTHAPVAAALAAGRVSTEQARVIVEAVERVPGDAVVGDRPARDLASEHLVDATRTWHVPGLRALGRRILEVVDPEGAQRREAARIAAEEARAEERCSLSMAQDAGGCWVGRFVLPELAGSMLHKALTAIANPAREESSGGAAEADEQHPRRAPRLKMGEALCEYIERFPASALPAAAGGAATIVVTTRLDDLRADLDGQAGDELIDGLGGTARLDAGGRISPGEVRRLACTAGLVPVVLGGSSQPLDLGRERRLHSRAQRLALTMRDGGCRAVGCDWPPGMCHAHHPDPWSHGGATSVENGLLLCPRHHRQAHSPRWKLELDEDRSATFRRVMPADPEPAPGLR